MRRLGVALLLAALAQGCGGDPFDEIAITAVELRSAPKLEFMRARVGMTFLEVRLEVENLSDEPIALKALDFALRDTRGRLHPFSAQVLMMGQPAGRAEAEVPRGARLPGSVVFQVPDDAVPAELIYRYEVAGGLVVRLASAG